MTDKVDVDVEVSGWTAEQTAFMLFERVYPMQRPESVDSALALYSKCLSAVRFSGDRSMGQRIAKMAD